MIEVWKDVPGYEGLYEVSNLGNIASQYKRCKSGERKNGRKYLKPILDYSGRYKVHLYSNKQQHTYMLHSLICNAFYGPLPADKVICHNNGNPLDNRLENLRYDTPSSNQQDSINHGTFRNGKKVLTEEDVVAIVTACQSGESQRSVANKYNVTRNCISSIMTGRTWSNITGFHRS